MKRDIRVYLEEMQPILTETEGMVAGKSSSDFDESPLLTRAMERMHEIVAEILKRMVAVAPETMTRIDSVAKIAGFRNVLAHEYD